MPQKSDVFSLGATGLILSGLSLDLFYKANPQTAPATHSTSGITLVEDGNTLYHFEGLPDTTGAFDSYQIAYALSGSPTSIIGVYRYGFTAPVQAPDSISSVAAGWQTSAVPCAVKKGSLLPYPAVKVDGLTENPTGATATFSLAPFGGGTAPTMNGVVGMSVSQAGATWSLQLWYKWDPVDWTETSPAAIAQGLYVGSFVVTLPSAGGTFTAPANDQLRVRVS
jgi:hypothetical protein